jgi:hypothetical protein
VPRSQRIHTHPGTYTIIDSDFEKNRLKILQRKRILARSGWGQNISFQSTEEKFFVPTPASTAPPPGTYSPKTSLEDYIPKENPRAGPFGSNLKVWGFLLSSMSSD